MLSDKYWAQDRQTDQHAKNSWLVGPSRREMKMQVEKTAFYEPLSERLRRLPWCAQDIDNAEIDARTLA